MSDKPIEEVIQELAEIIGKHSESDCCFGMCIADHPKEKDCKILLHPATYVELSKILQHDSD